MPGNPARARARPHRRMHPTQSTDWHRPLMQRCRWGNLTVKGKWGRRPSRLAADPDRGVPRIPALKSSLVSGQASNRNTLGSMAPVAMTVVARAIVAGLSQLVPKWLIRFARALTPGEESKTLHSRSAALAGDTRPSGNHPAGRGVPPAGIEPLPRHANACPSKGGLGSTSV